MRRWGRPALKRAFFQADVSILVVDRPSYVNT